MEKPTSKTPVSRCEELSLFSQTAMRSFTEQPALIPYADALALATAPLVAAHAEVTVAVRGLLPVRVKVRFTEYFAEVGVRALHKRAEAADGKKDGKIAKALFPNGLGPVVAPTGPAQVKAMEELEGRLKAAGALWPQAADELVKVMALRTEYATAVDARRAGVLAAVAARAQRTLNKEDFLDAYAKACAGVAGLFPRDRRLQNLFFDDLNTDSATGGGGGEEEPEGGGPPEPNVPG
ncbi:MAG: hypothetical protein HY904_26425 [Deltaproteobacteria bacterium]|nr:hypothetical protein [Deltaproteobacteria bacterium]